MNLLRAAFLSLALPVLLESFPAEGGKRTLPKPESSESVGMYSNYADDGSAVVLTPLGPTVIRTSPQDDVIVTPNLTLDAIWPITQLNTLRLDLGIGYAFYLDHSSNDTDYILIAPKSQIAFDIFG